MNRSTTTVRLAKTSLLYLALGVAVIVAIPILAGVAYAVRLVIPILLVAALVVLVASPAARRWFMEEADDSPSYKGVSFPTASLKVHPAHAWARLEPAGVANVGVDALALAALGAPTSIVPLPVGSRVEQGQLLFTLRRGERQLQVKAPVGGVVAAANSDALAHPEVIDKSPYGAGWVVRLEQVDARRGTTPLMGGSSVRRWFRAEVDSLLVSLSPNPTVPTMADGGVVAKDLASQIDDAKWAEITTRLFGA